MTVRLRPLVVVGALAALSLLSSACSVAFDFARVEAPPPPGAVAGRAVRSESHAPAPFARVATFGLGLVSRADLAARFRVSDLPLGVHLLRLDEDADGDGVPERATTRTVRLLPSVATPGELPGVALGDVALVGAGTVSGEVRRDGDVVAGAKVLVLRSLALVDPASPTVPLDVTLGVEEHATTDSRGRFVVPGVLEGSVTLLALDDEGDGTASASAPFALDLAAGAAASGVVLDITRALPEEGPASIVVAPPLPEGSEATVTVVAAGGSPLVVSARLRRDVHPVVDGRLALTLPAGRLIDVYVETPDVAGALFRAFITGDGAPVLGPLLLTDDTACLATTPTAAPRDCDRDGLPGLPLVIDDSGAVVGDLGPWAACVDVCAAAFGTNANVVGCTVGDVTYDCDDDGDGQPDVTEPPACYGLAAGGDRDGDAVCDVADPAPLCVGDVQLDEGCAFVAPPPWRDFVDGDDDAGVPDAGLEDAGLEDAGVIDGGADGGVELELVDVVVSAGASHSCAVDPSGALWCFGSNAQGQVNPTLTTSVVDVTLPTRAPLPAGDVVRVVAAAGEHTCAIVDGAGVTRRVTCWGASFEGQLAGATGALPVDIDVASAGVTNPVALSSRHTHTCVLDEDGDVVCWGTNASGECGQPASPIPVLPTAVPLPVDAVAIAAGKYFSCAVGVDGQVYCFGINAELQLGSGDGTPTHVPTAVDLGGAPLGGQIDVTAGSYHACARAPDGTTTCWGRGRNGATGVVDVLDAVAPTPIVGASFTSVAAGAEHTCALDVAGALSCWGDNALGQVFPGAAADPNPVPTLVLSTMRSVAGGYQHTCAVSANDAVRCFGSDAHGELGDGTTTTAPATAVSATALPKLATWVGSVSTDMADPNNWYPPVAPGTGDTIRFIGATTATSAAPLSVGHVIIEPEATGSISLTAPLTVEGSFVHDAVDLVLDADDVVVGVEDRVTVLWLVGAALIDNLTLAGHATAHVAGATVVANLMTEHDVLIADPVNVAGTMTIAAGSTVTSTWGDLLSTALVVEGTLLTYASVSGATLLVEDGGRFDAPGPVTFESVDVAAGGELGLGYSPLTVWGLMSVGGSVVCGDQYATIATLEVLDDGEFYAPTGHLNLLERLSLPGTGTFDANGGAVTIVPTSATFELDVSAVDFWRLSIIAPGVTMDLRDGATITVNENFIAGGAEFSPLILRAATSATIAALGGRNVQHVVVDHVDSATPMGGYDVELASGGEANWGGSCGNYVVEPGEQCDTLEVGLCGSCVIYDVPTERVWTGAAGDGSFTNPANWQGGIAPSPPDTIVFNAAGTGDCTLVGPRASVRIEGSYDGVVRTTAGVNVDGPLLLEAGTLSVQGGTLRCASGLTHHPTGLLEVQPGATLQLEAASTLNDNTNGPLARVFVNFTLGDSFETVRLLGTPITTLELMGNTAFGIILDPVYDSDDAPRIDSVVVHPEPFEVGIPVAGRFPTSLLPVGGDFVVADESMGGTLELENTLNLAIYGSLVLRHAVMRGRAIMRGPGDLVVDSLTAALLGNTIIRGGDVVLDGDLGGDPAAGALLVTSSGSLEATPGTASEIAYGTVRVDSSGVLVLHDANVFASVVTVRDDGRLDGGLGLLVANILSVSDGELELPTSTEVGTLTMGEPSRARLFHNCATLTLSDAAGAMSLNAGGHTLYTLVAGSDSGDLTFAANPALLPLRILDGMELQLGSGGQVTAAGGRASLVVGGDSSVVGATSWTGVDHVGLGYLTTDFIPTPDGQRVVAPATCGDGLVDVDEGCDPAAPDGAAACTATCTVRFRWECSGSGPTQACDYIGGGCGDGLPDPGEACDDGNLDNGDGCSASCVIEGPYTCGGCPSECIDIPI